MTKKQKTQAAVAFFIEVSDLYWNTIPAVSEYIQLLIDNGYENAGSALTKQYEAMGSLIAAIIPEEARDEVGDHVEELHRVEQEKLLAKFREEMEAFLGNLGVDEEEAAVLSEGATSLELEATLPGA